MDSPTQTLSIDGTKRVAIDLILLCFMPIPSLILEMTGTPFHRGFYCDDTTISYPLKSDTVPIWTVAVVGIGLPTITMIITELILYRHARSKLLKKTISKIYTVCGKRIHPWLVILYCTLGPFFFGLAVNQVTTDITKYSVGRLRPHFLTVCQPNALLMNCSIESGGNSMPRYVTEDVCTGDDHLIHEARLSHPSGHSSMSTFCSIYLMIYLFTRVRWSGSRLLRYMLSLLVIYLSLYTCLSRISDYKHHWSDVLGGAVLGLSVAVVVGLVLGALGRPHTTCKTPGIVAACNSDLNCAHDNGTSI